MRLDEIVLVLLFMAIFVMIAYDKGVNDLRDSIKTACTTEGQFTVDSRTYRCGVVTQETLDAAYNRQFERCRKWLHNPGRDREMP